MTMLSWSEVQTSPLRQLICTSRVTADVCMYGHHTQQSMDQPGQVANPARGQVNREIEYSPVPVRA